MRMLLISQQNGSLRHKPKDLTLAVVAELLPDVMHRSVSASPHRAASKARVTLFAFCCRRIRGVESFAKQRDSMHCASVYAKVKHD